MESSLDISEDAQRWDNEEMSGLARAGKAGWYASIRGFVAGFFPGLGRKDSRWVTLDVRVMAL